LTSLLNADIPRVASAPGGFPAVFIAAIAASVLDHACRKNTAQKGRPNKKLVHHFPPFSF
jgi:hypothetical protein